jgi:hypothetical protein
VASQRWYDSPSIYPGHPAPAVRSASKEELASSKSDRRIFQDRPAMLTLFLAAESLTPPFPEGSVTSGLADKIISIKQSFAAA